MSKRIDALRKKLGVKSKAASTEATCSGGCGHERARLNPYSSGHHWIEEYNRWYPRDNVPEKVARVGKHTHDLGTAHPLPRNQGGETAVYFVMPCGDLWAQDVDGIVDGAYDTETMDSEDKEALESDHASDLDWMNAGTVRGRPLELANTSDGYVWRVLSNDRSTTILDYQDDGFTGANNMEGAIQAALTAVREAIDEGKISG